jgi:DNA primase
VGVQLKTYERSETVKLKDRIYEMNHLASEFYNWLLLNHRTGKEALSYVLGRGIKKQSLETFGIGYAPNSWESLQKFLLKKGYTKEEMDKAGLIVRTERGTYFDMFRGRVMFALRDHRGNTVGFAGRVFGEREREKAPKYINTTETPVYIKGNILYGLDVTHEAIKRENLAVIVEGEIDCIQSFQAGVTNVVAIKGSALTEGHVNLLKRYTENIAISLDSDFAGDAAARRGIEIADSANFNIRVVQLKAGKDPDECVRTGASIWKESVKKASPIYDFILDSAVVRHDLSRIEEKKKIGEEVLPIFAKISNMIIQGHYLKKLAGTLGVTEEAVTAELERVKKQQNLQKVAPVAIPSGPSKLRGEILEETILAMLFQSSEGKKDFDDVGKIISTKDFSSRPSGKLFSHLGEWYEVANKLNIRKFASGLPVELVETFDRIYLIELPVQIKDDDWERELIKTAQEIKRLSLRRKLTDLTSRIRDLEKKTGKNDEVTTEIGRLNEEFTEISSELRKLS